MTPSPKIHATRISSTANRGVEAKEIEITNTRLDVTSSESESTAAPALVPKQSHQTDDSTSFVQVVVHKHNRRAAATSVAAQTSPRLPTASSPLAVGDIRKKQGTTLPRDEGVYSSHMSHPLMLAYSPPAPPAPPGLTWFYAYPAGAGAGGDASVPPRDLTKHDLVGVAAGARPGDMSSREQGVVNNNTRMTKWKTLSAFIEDEGREYSNGPERVEVYYLESAGGERAFLATSGARGSRMEAWGARAGRAGGAALAEVATLPALAGDAAAALAAAASRAALLPARALLTAVVQTGSDYALKPALALTFNALLHPPLVCAGQVLRAVRDALRPLALALTDWLEPLTRLLAAPRLVQIHIERCRCAPQHI